MTALQPYETTACRAYQHRLGHVADQLERMVVVDKGAGQLRRFDLAKYKDLHYYLLVAGDVELPMFSQPLSFHDEDGKCFASDVRLFTKLDNHRQVTVKMVTEYNLRKVQIALQVIWDSLGPKALGHLNEFPCLVYSRWLGDAITRRMALDAGVQINLYALWAFFFLTRFYSEEQTKIPPNDLQRLGAQIATVSYLPQDKAVALIEHLSIPKDVTSFVEILKEHSGSVRLENFSTAALFVLLGGSWFGANAKELIAVAVEHPPTYMALLYSTFTERSVRECVLAKLGRDTERFSSSDFFKREIYAMAEVLQ